MTNPALVPVAVMGALMLMLLVAASVRVVSVGQLRAALILTLPPIALRLKLRVARLSVTNWLLKVPRVPTEMSRWLHDQVPLVPVFRAKLLAKATRMPAV